MWCHGVIQAASKVPALQKSKDPLHYNRMAGKGAPHLRP